jgi:hypothetical protein
MVEVAGHDMMPPLAHFRYQTGTDRAETTSHQNIH